MSDDIVDLIRRIFVVDPGERITIAEMKEHRGFRKGLDPAYVLPRPVRFGRARSPISGITEKVGEISVAIGYSEVRKLRRISRTERDIVAKMVALSLSESFDLSDLSWDAAKSRPVPSNVSTKTSQLEMSGYTLAGVMWHVQRIAERSELLFCHPDPTALILRSPDGELYVTVRANIVTSQTIALTVILNRGTVDRFDALCREVGRSPE